MCGNSICTLISCITKRKSETLKHLFDFVLSSRTKQTMIIIGLQNGIHVFHYDRIATRHSDRTVTRNYDAVTHNYEKNLFTMLQSVRVFRLQVKWKCVVLLSPVDEQCPSQERFHLFFHIYSILQRIHTSTKNSFYQSHFLNSSHTHILRFRKKIFFFDKIIFHFC